MSALVWKLLRQHISIGQLAGFFLANLFGMMIVLLSPCHGAYLMNGTEHVRPEVTAVLRALSPAGNGKGLAWETSCEDVNPSPSSPKIRSCNIRITFCMAEPVI